MSRSKTGIEIRRERHPDNRGGDLVIRTRHLRMRLAAYYGTPPGSHVGLWRTHSGELYGVNLRIGRRYTGPCLTVFVHILQGR